MPTECAFCNAVGGTCWPHRARMLRLLELPDVYGPAILGWGADGGPAESIPKAATPMGAAEFPAALALYNSLSPEDQDLVRDCPNKRRETVKSCCGGEIPGDVCRGGSRDGEAVQTADCTRCVAARRPG